MPASSHPLPISPLRILVMVALAGTLTVTAAGCGASDADGGAAADPTVVEIEFAGGRVTPSGGRVEVGAGDPVDLQVTADEPGTLHLHTDPEQEFSYEEGTETFEIQIDRPGLVEVESHELDQVVVQLEVR